MLSILEKSWILNLLTVLLKSFDNPHLIDTTSGICSGTVYLSSDSLIVVSSLVSSKDRGFVRHTGFDSMTERICMK
jgi:hypothetical protein